MNLDAQNDWKKESSIWIIKLFLPENISLITSRFKFTWKNKDGNTIELISINYKLGFVMNYCLSKKGNL